MQKLFTSYIKLEKFLTKNGLIINNSVEIGCTNK